MGLAWAWAAVPYLAVAAAFVIALACAIAVDGHRLVRLAILAAVAALLPWALGSALAAMTEDPHFADRMLRAGNAAVPMVGPAILLIFMVEAGQVERYRVVLAAALALAVVSMVAAWTTDLVIADVQRLRTGAFYAIAGPLLTVHVGQVAAAGILGLVIRSRARDEAMTGQAPVLVALTAVGLYDGAIANQVIDAPPMAWLVALLGIVLAVRALFAGDTVRTHRLDRGALLEAGMAGAAIVVVGTFVVTGRVPADPWLGALVVVTPMVMASWVGRWVSRRVAARAIARTGEPTLQAVRPQLQRATDAAAIEGTLREILAGVQLTDVHVHVRGRVEPGHRDIQTRAWWRARVGAHPWVVPAKLRAGERGRIDAAFVGRLRDGTDRRWLPIEAGEDVVGVIDVARAVARPLRADERHLLTGVLHEAGLILQSLAIADLAQAEAAAAQARALAQVVDQRLNTPPHAKRCAIVARAVPRPDAAAWRMIDGGLVVCLARPAAGGPAGVLASASALGALHAQVHRRSAAEVRHVLQGVVPADVHGHGPGAGISSLCLAAGVVTWAFDPELAVSVWLGDPAQGWSLISEAVAGERAIGVGLSLAVAVGLDVAKALPHIAKLTVQGMHPAEAAHALAACGGLHADEVTWVVVPADADGA